MEKCKICDVDVNQITLLQNSSDILRVNCPLCGVYAITDTLLNSDFNRISQDNKILLSAYLRNNSSVENLLTLNSYNVNDLVELASQNGNIRISQKLNKILDYIIQSTNSTIGVQVGFDLFHDFTLFYCKNSHELKSLLMELSKKGWVEVFYNNPRIIAVSLTVGGLEYYETLTEEDSELDADLKILRKEYLNKNLQKIIDNATNQNIPVSFIMVDIDHFKKFNDEYGHLIGDDVLKATCSLMLETVGNKGKVVRFGGEEICAILPSCEVNEAKDLAEEIRVRIESYSFNVQGKVNLKITISAGVSGVIEKIKDKELIERADKALRLSKFKGRNQINIYNESWGTLSNELIVIESMHEVEIRNYAKKAIEALSSKQYEEFAKSIKIAFDKALFKWRDSYLAQAGAEFYNLSIPKLITNNILNLNVIEFTKFEALLPRVSWFENGNYQVCLTRSYTLESEEKEMKFCLKFFLDSIIQFKKQVEI